MYERKCENWLKTFLEWTLPRSQAPESVLTLCGLYCLSSALRRHVRIGQEWLGGWENLAHLYIMFIADPGVINKSTSINYVEQILDELPHIARSPGTFTTPIILKRLVKSNDNSLSVIVPEFGMVAEKSGVTLYTVLTDLFDGKKKIEEETISRDIVLASNPIVNMLGATTPDWIVSNMPPAVLNGGFGSRTIFIHEHLPRQRRLMYHRVIKDGGVFDEMFQRLVRDLEYISEYVQGDFKFDSLETADKVEAWFQTIGDSYNVERRKIKGYLQRKPAYVLKMAMLLTIAQTDELVISWEMMEVAIALMESFEKKMTTAFKHVGLNKFSMNIDEIILYVKMKKRVRRADLLEEFQATAEPVLFETLIKAAQDMKKISPLMMIEGEGYYASLIA